MVPFEDALVMASQVVEHLKPHVVRMKAAGSLRRQRHHVGDIEFVVEPRMVPVDLFGAEGPDVRELKRQLLEMGTWVKGGERMMQITDLLGREGARLDIYLVWEPAQWGSLLAIRTGPAGLGQYVVTKMRDYGYRHDHGRAVLQATGETEPTPTEEDFFALARIPCLVPRQRDDQLRALTKRSRPVAWGTEARHD